MITIRRVGLLATVQDRGRLGRAHLGVPRAGAVDGAAYDLAHRLLGSDPGAAAIEVLLGDVVIDFDDDHPFVITGAPLPAVLDAEPIGTHRWAYARAGQRLSLGRPSQGVWSYLAVGGGVITDPVLGSRSTDTLSGLGPAPLAAGDRVPVAPSPSAPGTAADVVTPVRSGDPVPVGFRWGPRVDWITADARARFTAATWTVSAAVDRTGSRLVGPELAYVEPRQLPSEGQLVGSVQLPPSGRPIVLLANHAPTGGYPVIAVVEPADLSAVAQAAPGSRLRFVAVF